MTKAPVSRRRMRNEKAGNNIIPKELLNLTPNFIAVLDTHGGIVEMNDSAARILRLTDGDIRDAMFYDYCVTGERERIHSAVTECIQHRTPATLQTKLVGSNGTLIDVDVSLTCYPSDDTAAMRYCVLVGRDVSEERQKELDLLRFSNIAHYTVNPLEITDSAGNIIYVNPAFEKASGYTKEELLGKNPHIFGSGKQPKIFWKKMWDTITSGKVWVGEVENRRRDGEPFHTHLLISPIIEGDGKIVGYFGVHRDLTGQKHLEHQLIHAQKMESIGMLAAGLAHEVGNPLTSISSLVQIIQRETDDEFTQEKLELIKSQVTRISRIIRDLVDFSRRSSYEVQLTDINKSLREAVEIVRVGKKAKQISFEVELDPQTPKLPLVPDQIEQVFINILINAVDAINSRDSAGAGTGGNIQLKSSTSEDEVKITVRDNGKGIPEEMLPKIFEPFFTTKKVGEGTGLGLWVSYGIIKSFQGNIAVQSIEGEGTTFIVTLPMVTEISIS